MCRIFNVGLFLDEVFASFVFYTIAIGMMMQGGNDDLHAFVAFGTGAFIANVFRDNAHFNPVRTIGNFVAKPGGLTIFDTIWRLLGQLTGMALGGLVLMLTQKSNDFFTNTTDTELTWVNQLILEAFVCFVICMALNMRCTPASNFVVYGAVAFLTRVSNNCSGNPFRSVVSWAFTSIKAGKKPDPHDNTLPTMAWLFLYGLVGAGIYGLWELLLAPICPGNDGKSLHGDYTPLTSDGQQVKVVAQ